MFLVGLLSWWYTDGWRNHLAATGRRLQSIAEFFSIGQLAMTLFSPFRQISAGHVTGPVGVQLRALFDQLLSRLIGMVIRTMFIVIGLISIVGLSVLEGVMLISWFVVPLLPIAGCIVAATGWLPWK